MNFLLIILSINLAFYFIFCACVCVLLNRMEMFSGYANFGIRCRNFFVRFSTNSWLVCVFVEQFGVGN